MPRFSELSLFKLASCHPELQLLFNTVIQTIDCTIMEGHRDQAAQEAAFANGTTKLHYPHGKHNAMPSLAVDCVPFPVPRWERTMDFIYFGGLVMGIAIQLKAQDKMKYNLKYGGDFNSNYRISDSSFFDLVHFQLME